MKFYDCKPAPSPRRVRIFLAEKGEQIPVEEVDLRGGGQLDEDFRQRNPDCTVPALELDDGTVISESFAICSRGCPRSPRRFATTRPAFAIAR